MPKAFQVAVEQQHGAIDDDLYEFTFSDDPDTPQYAHRPDEGQLMLLIDADASDSPMSEKAQLLSTVLFGMLTDETRAYTKRRLASRDDPFSIHALLAVMQNIVAAESGRPTQPSSDSSPSRRSGGRTSTAPAQRTASTRSASPSTGSATSSSTSRRKASRTPKNATSSSET